LYQYEYAGEKVERNDKKLADDNLEDASIGILEKFKTNHGSARGAPIPHLNAPTSSHIKRRLNHEKTDNWRKRNCR
jgi:hypothetical protein